jgi:hypothetical protein
MLLVGGGEFVEPAATEVLFVDARAVEFVPGAGAFVLAGASFGALVTVVLPGGVAGACASARFGLGR